MALVALRREGGAFLRRIGPVAAASPSRFFSAVEAEGWTLADEAAEEEGAKQPVPRALDQMYCDLRFQKLAPSWLPFRPEDSFFIPPSPPLSKIIQDLAHSAHSPITVHHLNFVLNPLGWTSSDAIHHRMAAHAEPSQDK